MLKSILCLPLLVLFPLLFSCNTASSEAPGGIKIPVKTSDDVKKILLTPPPGKAIAVFAEGCFWCSVELYEEVVGVDSALAGYAGGKTDDPTYEDVSGENTGHAESVAVYYDPKLISYAELLNAFFSSQDPTTPDRQGPDRGSSYRSIIFYQNADEKAAATKAIATWDQSGTFSNPIVTEVLPLNNFYRAEEYHQHYVERNPSNSYVQGVSVPRYKRFQATYKGKLKSNQR